MFIDLMTPRNKFIDSIDEKIFLLRLRGYNFNKEKIKLLAILFVCGSSEALAASNGEITGNSRTNGFYSIVFSTFEALKGISLKDLDLIKTILVKRK